MLTIGVVALAVTDVERAADFWRQALGYELREDGLGGWAKVLMPPPEHPHRPAAQPGRTALADRLSGPVDLVN